MKIRYWGTAAAEGIPALFCDCEVCKEAREKGGRYVRMRAQVMLDNSLLVDFGPDTYANSVRFRFDLSSVKDVLITHVHADHFYPTDLFCRQMSMGRVLSTPLLTLHGSEDVRDIAMRTWSVTAPADPDRLLQQKRVAFHEMQPFETYSIGDFQVTPLPARHNTAHPHVYIFEKNGKTLFLYNDSGYLCDEAMAFLKQKGIRFDLVSYDCTYGAQDAGESSRHMGIPNNVEMQRRFIHNGNYKENTVSVITHFSHNTPTVGYGDMVKIAQSHGFTLAYDGLEIEI